MRKIVYYVAASLDGYISGPDDDISGFVSSGSGLDKYLADLESFDTVIMGRNTYEFGYKYGLEPGQRAYEHMRHFIFSESLVLEDPEEGVEVHGWNVDFIRKLKEAKGSDIYLCGGGVFAGWMLENKLIDTLKVKWSPFIMGSGVRMFGQSSMKVHLKVLNRESYDHGMQIATYGIEY